MDCWDTTDCFTVDELSITDEYSDFSVVDVDVDDEADADAAVIDVIVDRPVV